MTTIKENEARKERYVASLQESGAPVTKITVDDTGHTVWVVDVTDPSPLLRCVVYYASTDSGAAGLVNIFYGEGKPMLHWYMGSVCDDATPRQIAEVLRVIWTDVSKRLWLDSV